MFVELILDDKVYKQRLGEILTSTTTTSKGLETSWKALGVKTNEYFDKSRLSAQNAYTLIEKSGKYSADEIVRAEKAKNEKIQQFNEQQFGKQTSLLEGIKSNWLAVSAAVVAAWYTVSKVVGAVEGVVMAAARYETLGIVMQTVGTNAGYTGAQMDQFAQGLEKTGISMTGARESLTKMAQAELDLVQSSKLARIAQDAAVIGNINSTEAFNQLVYGIQSANVRVLRTIGINVDFEHSYKTLELQLGKTKEEMTEAEKAQARLNVVLESGKRIAGTYEAAMGTAGKQALSLERHFENLKVLIGAAFTPAFAEMIDIITGAVVDLNKELGGEGKKAIEQWGIDFRLVIISIEAEFMRLAMLLDKFGGTFTSAQMLLYAPGAALGFESSKKRFEAAAEANIEYERRYLETEKALQALADKANALEKSRKLEKSVKEYVKEYSDFVDKLLKLEADKSAELGRIAMAEQELKEISWGYMAKAQKDVTAKELEKSVEEYSDFVDKLLKLEADKSAELGQIAMAEQELKEVSWDYMAKVQKDATAQELDELQKAMEEEGKLWEQSAKEEEKFTADKLKAYQSIYQDLKGMAWDNYNIQVELIKRQTDEYIKAGIDEITATKWRDDQIRKVWISSAQKSNDFFAGVQAGFMSLQDSALTFGQVGYNVMVGFSTASRDVFADVFMDGIKGELKSFEDYWTAFTDSMLQIFVNMLAQMATEWVMSHVWMSNQSGSILGSGSAAYSQGAGGFGGGSIISSAAQYMGLGSAFGGGGAAEGMFAEQVGGSFAAGTGAEATFMSVLGPSLAAAGIGYVGGSLVFGKEGAMGSAIGAGLGMAVGGPIGAVAGGFIGGLIDKIFHEGGMIPYAHSGMFLKPDERMVIGQTGEGIVSRRGMQNIGGEAGLNSLNRGGASGGSDRPLNISVIVAGEEFTALIARVSDGVRVKAERRNMGIKRMYN